MAVDSMGRGIPRVRVIFEVQSGGGSVLDAVVETDAEGVARIGEWRLGPTLGTQTLAARASHGGAERMAVIEVTAEWRWTQLSPPLGDLNLARIRFHPADDDFWYSGSLQQGLYVSTDGGRSWQWPLQGVGLNFHGLKVDPRHPDTLFTGLLNRLMVSGDRGLTWSVAHEFDPALSIRSVEILRDGTLLVGAQWPEGRTPGVFRSEDGGGTWTHHPYGVNDNEQVLTWALLQHPSTGIVWSANEVADHPHPYRPPFLYSADGGRSWIDATDRLPHSHNVWHVTSLAARGGNLYALAEGTGLFLSRDGGESWENLGRDFSASLLVPAQLPGVVLGGQYASGDLGGEVFISFDGGRSFQRAGRLGYTVSSIAVTADGRRVLAATWGGGIWSANIP